jgi:hypothetical protein
VVQHSTTALNRVYGVCWRVVVSFLKRTTNIQSVVNKLKDDDNCVSSSRGLSICPSLSLCFLLLGGGLAVFCFLEFATVNRNAFFVHETRFSRYLYPYWAILMWKAKSESEREERVENKNSNGPQLCLAEPVFSAESH